MLNEKMVRFNLDRTQFVGVLPAGFPGIYDAAIPPRRQA
jgi:hypothetical protein